jgi:hypothetical protein
MTDLKSIGPQEAPADRVDIACEAYAKATNYYIPFHRGLSSESSDRMREGMRAALAAVAATPAVPPPQEVNVPYEAIEWPNGCNSTIPHALRYLARNPRPAGGQDRFNAEHLEQLADEIARIAKFQLYRQRVGYAPTGAPAAPSPQSVRVTDETVERAWAAIVGSDVAGQCFNASIIRADLKVAIEAAFKFSPAAKEKTSSTPCPECKGLGAEPIKGEDCVACGGGGTALGPDGLEVEDEQFSAAGAEVDPNDVWEAWLAERDKVGLGSDGPPQSAIAFAVDYVATHGRSPAARALVINDLITTVRDEWGSHLCYRDALDATRNCKPDKCRCFDVANAILSQFDVRRKP